MPAPAPLLPDDLIYPVRPEEFLQLVSDTLGNAGDSTDGFDEMFNSITSTLDASEAAISAEDRALVRADFVSGQFRQNVLDPMAIAISNGVQIGDALKGEMYLSLGLAPDGTPCTPAGGGGGAPGQPGAGGGGPAGLPTPPGGVRAPIVQTHLRGCTADMTDPRNQHPAAGDDVIGAGCAGFVWYYDKNGDQLMFQDIERGKPTHVGGFGGSTPDQQGP